MVTWLPIITERYYNRKASDKNLKSTWKLFVLYLRNLTYLWVKQPSIFTFTSMGNNWKMLGHWIMVLIWQVYCFCLFCCLVLFLCVFLVLSCFLFCFFGFVFCFVLVWLRFVYSFFVCFGLGFIVLCLFSK